MRILVVIFVALILAGGAIAGVIYYFLREKKRNEQEQESNFRSALLASLRKKGPSGLNFHALVEQSEVSFKIAERTAQNLYLQFFLKALDDDQITEQERSSLNKFRDALHIPEKVVVAIETRAKEERYRNVAMAALADGVITSEEQAELENLRRSFGISSQQAKQIVGRPATDGYLALFRKVISDGRITAEEMKELQRYRQSMSISRDEANDIVQRDVLELYRQWFFNIVQDGEVTDEEEQGLHWLKQEFRITSTEIDYFESQLQEVKRLAALRRGELPRIRTTKLLEGGEICHWEGKVTFQWKTATQVKEADGELIVTNQRLIFTSQLRSFEFSPSKIIDIALYTDALNIQCSSKNGGGAYFLSQPEILEAILVGLTKIHKYQTSANYASTQTRHIPDSVRREVWHRDGGKCVRCSATDYLEYDHIIPHSKGGANTVSNVQILCRRCNNLKRNRI